MSYKGAYSQLPSAFLREPLKRRSYFKGFIKFFITLIFYLLATLGLLVLGVLAFLYVHGQEAARDFDDEFIIFFGKFVEQVIWRKNVAGALIIKMPLESQVTTDQAVEAMTDAAVQSHLRLIANYPLFPLLNNQPVNPSQQVTIFQFIDVEVTESFFKYNPELVTHLPYRIVLYGDQQGQLWLATLNFNLLLHGTQSIDPQLKAQVLKVQDNLLKVMNAGAHGAI
jgi:uncharacterized protein (DUF302 family)